MRLVGCVLLALLGTACQKDGVTMNFRHNREGKGTPAARLSGDSITVEELQQRFQEMSPYARARYQTVEQRKEYLDGLVRFEVLSQEALRRGLQNEPDVAEMAKKVMVQKLITQEMDAKTAQVSDAELSEFYQKHQSDYVKPEMVRLSGLFVTDPAQVEPLLEKAKALPPLDFGGFGRLARENSLDEKTKSLDGDLRYLSAEELAAQYGAPVAAAAAAMKVNGELSGPVAVPKGVWILKLQGRQAALNLTLEQVQPQLKGRILSERRQVNFDKFVQSLKEKSNYQLDEQALAGLQVDMKAPTREAHGPPPGFISGNAAAGPR